MRNSTTENTGRLANVLIMLLLLTPDSVFALGQVEVVEAESTIVPAERYPSDGYFDAVSDRKNRAQIFDSNAPAAVASAAATNTDILLQLQSLQAELRQLRGLVEEQRHAIEMLDRKRIDDYLDLDHRLSVVHQSQVEAKPAPDKEEGLNFSFVPMVATQPAVSTFDQAEPPLSLEARQAYRQSYQLVKDREFERAQTSLTDFIQRYPSSSYIPNAYFWLGELQYLAMELPLSRDSFISLIEQYPQHKKVADAKFKLGKVYHQLGQSAKARSTLESVLSDHAQSTAANPAREYLNSNLR
jgi:tol-pal system protein YbgF